MEITFLVGRILLGGFFLMSAINHFTQSDGLSQYAASKNLPKPKAAVFVSGVMLLLGGLGVLLGIYVEWALGILAVFLVMASFLFHTFWMETEQKAKMMEMTQFMKNMAILGAILMLYSVATPWAYSLF